MTGRLGALARVTVLATILTALVASGVASPALAESSADAASVTISGRVTGDGGTGVEHAAVSICRPGACVYNSFTGPSGEYTATGIPAGTYTLRFTADGYQSRYWSPKGTQLKSVEFTVVAGQSISGANGALVRGGTISGRVTGRDGKPINGAYVYITSQIYYVGAEAIADWNYTAFVDDDGKYSVSGLPSSSYDIEFLPPNDRLRSLQRTFWRGGTDRWTAGRVPISGTQVVTGIDAVLIPPVTQTRLAGADRYATAVAISQSRSEPAGGAVFITSGSDFPDALSAAPLAALRGAPLLLTGRDSLPAVVRKEIQRLKPSSITIVGGVGAISSAVERELRGLVSGATTTRLQGTDRYATSANAARAGFPQSRGGVIYVASGALYPDALSGAYLAGRNRAPLLLVRSAEVPDVILDQIQRLAPERIVILGGAGAVSRAVESRLSALSVKPVVRLGGADRFATSIAASQHGFAPGTAGVVYVASGLNFPDALAAAPLAASTGGPVLLTRPADYTDAFDREFLRLHSSRAVIIGGVGSVDPAICNAFERLGGPTYYDGDPPSPCGQH
ncbi:MAG: cell wall-binding repeat-containing protein [Microbacterium sp.]|jgi:putative cell wall-binding protein|nr:cell wall-binding repeat-containing protein [Microbacterium sp.]